MPVRPEFLEFVLEQLGRIAPVTHRRMFGGVGLYADGLFFAVMDDDRLYFKTDDTNRPAYEARGLGPFRPMGEDGPAMQYHPVPEELLDDPDALRPWMDAALDVARRARRGGTRRRR